MHYSASSLLCSGGFQKLVWVFRGKLVGVRHGKAGRKNTKFNPWVLASDALSCLNFFESLRVSESKVLADWCCTQSSEDGSWSHPKDLPFEQAQSYPCPVSKISTAVFSTVRTHSTECNDATRCLAIRSKAGSVPSAGLLDVVLAYCKEELRTWIVMLVQSHYQLPEECSSLWPAKPLHRTCSGCTWPCRDGFKDSLQMNSRIHGACESSSPSFFNYFPGPARLFVYEKHASHSLTVIARKCRITIHKTQDLSHFESRRPKTSS